MLYHDTIPLLHHYHITDVVVHYCSVLDLREKKDNQSLVTFIIFYKFNIIIIKERELYPRHPSSYELAEEWKFGPKITVSQNFRYIRKVFPSAFNCLLVRLSWPFAWSQLAVMIILLRLRTLEVSIWSGAAPWFNYHLHKWQFPHTVKNSTPIITWNDTIQLSPEREANSGLCIPRHEVSRYISSTVHQPWGG